MIHEEAVGLRPLRAPEREVLMGFLPGHVKLMHKKEPEGREQQVEAEDLECAALGNSFHTGAVASLVDLGLGALERSRP